VGKYRAIVTAGGTYSYQWAFNSPYVTKEQQGVAYCINFKACILIRAWASFSVEGKQIS
jgi:hypothetical protein